MNRKRELIKDEKGQSLVEFALLLPVLMLILLGIVEFGFMLNAKIIVTSAAREGVRVVAIKEDASLDLEPAVNKALDLDYLEISNLVVAKDVNTDTAIPMAIVTVSGDVAFLTDFFDFLVPAGSIHITSKAQMRVEYYIAP